MEILVNILMGCIGTLFFTFFRAKDFIYSNKFNLGIFISENIKTWTISTVIVSLIAVVVYFAPEDIQQLTVVFGITLGTSPMSFFMLGLTVNTFTKRPLPKKIR